MEPVSDPKSSSEEGIRIYSPEPLLRNPGPLLRAMVHDLRLSVGLAWQLAGRDIKAQYRQSLLGYFWAFVPPLLIAASFMLLKEGGVLSAGAVRVAYGAYVITGTLLWQTFAEAVAAPLRTVTTSRDILVRINFPREALILAGVLITSLNAALRLLMIVPVLLYYRISPTLDIAFIPLGVISLILAGTSIGLLLTPVGVLYRDIEKALPLVLLLWMLLTPVAYPVSTIGSEPNWLALNFASPLIEATRSSVLGDAPIPWGAVATVTSGAFLVLLAGWLLLRLAAPHLVARLGL